MRELANARWRRNGPVLLVGPFAALHLLMFGYDVWHPGRFLNADRADLRIEVIQHFGQAWQGGGELAGFFAGHGIVGDWLPQAFLYLAGGQYLVIAAQVLLALLSIVWVRNIGLRLGLDTGRASAAAALYGALPHTLVFPHQLAAEAIFVPLVVLSFAVCARAPGTKDQAGGGAALGAATLVRPITMLWPVIYAAFARVTPRARAAYLAAALAPLGLWMCFIYAATGEFSMGRSAHDLGHNLYQRVHRMAAHPAASERPLEQPRAQRTLSVSEYTRFVVDHPGAALAHSARDLATIGFKSGVERIVLDYFDLFPESRRELQDPVAGWRMRVEQYGPVDALAGIFRSNPALTLASLGGALLFAVFIALAALGAFAWLRDDVPAETRRLRILLITFVLYIVATAQAVDAVQSRHRAPAEFVLCLLAVAALALLSRRSWRTQHAG